MIAHLTNLGRLNLGLFHLEWVKYNEKLERELRRLLDKHRLRSATTFVSSIMETLGAVFLRTIDLSTNMITTTLTVEKLYPGPFYHLVLRTSAGIEIMIRGVCHHVDSTR